MREGQNPPWERCEIPVAEIEVDRKSRDDIPKLLLGLQHLYCEETFRRRLFALLEEHIPPATGETAKRTGTELWQILVIGVMNLALEFDCDQLHGYVNRVDTIRQFLGHIDRWDEEKYYYEFETVVDCAALVSPALLLEVRQLLKESGHKAARMHAWRSLAPAR